ncbi:hypothetical protein KGM_202597 [Danaus plexippus plexippus]|uniref:Uncharacterized protein n=1 Tax=Danaus plexippus plexippus TaxID=278856 RepID=A0A212EJB9_DANPL|nr:hypothetical protein KGM_202597 [Danaus plexippus plexippus]
MVVSRQFTGALSNTIGLSCVCSLLCKLISFFLSLIIIVGIILIILWQTGVIFKEDGGNNNTLNSLLSGTAGH